jgi:hypothetical protein
MLYTLHKNIGPSQALRSAINDLRTIISRRMQSHFNQSAFHLDPWLSEHFNGNLFKQDIAKHLPQLSSADEWIVLLLALTPHLDPAFFSSIITEHLPNGGDFPEFGGARGNGHRGLLPTGETAQFIIAGVDMERRLQLQKLFEEDHFFYRNDILYLEPVREGEPFMSGRIILSPEWANLLLTGKESKPKFSTEFPAKLTTTKMNWNDLVLHPYTTEQIEDIKRWIRYHHIIEADANLSRKINPGYRVLFHGPPGTGKTLTAALIGKEFEKDVYRIDLSQIVSKYIGETEKNLNKIFDKAEHKDWILFFDEADALFGKRTSVQSAHDKYANQEVSFLLQRIEEFNGLMILASNFKSNIDEAFLRRFHSIIHFPMPNAQERCKLWKQSIPESVSFHDVDELKQLADKYEISGASIINVIQYATLKALGREGHPELILNDLVNGIRRELLKEEKSV